MCEKFVRRLRDRVRLILDKMAANVVGNSVKRVEAVHSQYEELVARMRISPKSEEELTQLVKEIDTHSVVKKCSEEALSVLDLVQPLEAAKKNLPRDAFRSIWSLFTWPERIEEVSRKPSMRWKLENWC